MKRIKNISFLVISLLMLLTFEVYAASGTQLRITGNAQVKAGSTGIVVVMLEGNDDKIGAITGKVTGNENISNIKMVGKNGWQVTYNEGTGDFNALKAEGAITEEFAEITYTVKDGVSGKANITVGSLKLTTIEYKTITLTNISKEISIESKNSNEQNPTPETKPEDTPETKPESTPETKPETKPESTPETKPESTPENKPATKPENKPTNTQTNRPTNAPTTLPYAGISNFVVVFAVVIAIITIFCYIKYKQYPKI